ncbi:branched-chain-amino-acid aminotransferase 3, chloroplastic isoform X3 [Gossypium australe]|uniref:Branched-chain-amino-acid aminotransferase 3, chloroplastic isoform X3 n=1 Tax=Gossypium australe TaxID=47621 RepID=A0A5B6W4I0_9ROSI|nr:branched-chain-amino-acid aminotransferase 3, chloroplastic isoform X3 [Gossypium australe]
MYKDGLKSINMVVENDIHRATLRGIMKAQAKAKANGFSDVLYLDSIHNRYLEEVSTANIFVVKVGERLVPVEELFDADEVFCCVNDVFVLPVGNITLNGKRNEQLRTINHGANGGLWREWICGISTALLSTCNIQMGLIEDKMGWTTLLN